MKKSISTRMRNLMNQYVGMSFDYFFGGFHYMWSVKILSVMDNGYFLTEINDNGKTWKSNASYGEIKNNIKKGLYIAK